jgi:hypothetical protein
MRSIRGLLQPLGGKPSEVEDEIAANGDPFSSLVETQRSDKHSFPSAVVLLDARRAPEVLRVDGLSYKY